MSEHNNDMTNESFGDVTPPQPLPNARFRFQGLAATYKKPENDGDDHTYSFCYRPIAPVSAVEAEDLPDDWQAMKIWVRFRVPSWNTHFDAKNFFKVNGIDVSDMTRKQACEAFKKAKPVIDADVTRRSWVNKTTGMQQWDHNLSKPELASAGVETGVEAEEEAA